MKHRNGRPDPLVAEARARPAQAQSEPADPPEPSPVDLALAKVIASADAFIGDAFQNPAGFDPMFVPDINKAADLRDALAVYHAVVAHA